MAKGKSSRRSRFRRNVPVSLGLTQAAFEDWLTDRDYKPANEDTPMAIAAISLVDEFLDEYPDFEQYARTAKRHAEAIGFVSDYDIDTNVKLGYEEDE